MVTASGYGLAVWMRTVWPGRAAPAAAEMVQYGRSSEPGPASEQSVTARSLST